MPDGYGPVESDSDEEERTGVAVKVPLIDYHPNKKRDMTLDQVYKLFREKIQVGDKDHFGVVNFNVNTPDTKMP